MMIFLSEKNFEIRRIPRLGGSKLHRSCDPSVNAQLYINEEWSKKNYNIRGQKGENRLPERKN
jgi:hypothetical protein